MIRVYTAEHPTEAHMVKGILEANGIESVVRGEILFAARGELPLTPETAPTVWIVEKKRYHDARKIISRYEKANRENGRSIKKWHCGTCGEVLEDQFTHCWQCGKPRYFPPEDGTAL